MTFIISMTLQQEAVLCVFTGLLSIPLDKRMTAKPSFGPIFLLAGMPDKSKFGLENQNRIFYESGQVTKIELVLSRPIPPNDELSSSLVPPVTSYKIKSQEDCL